MPRVGFEPTTPVFEREKTVHALDRATTVIGKITDIGLHNDEDKHMMLSSCQIRNYYKFSSSGKPQIAYI
jgi:hypothetical protein